MPLDHSPIYFAPEATARALALPQAVVDALVSSGALRVENRVGVNVIRARDVETVLRDALMHLYRAEALASEQPAEAAPREEDTHREETLELDGQPAADLVVEPDPLVTHSIAEFQRETTERDNLRLAPRYVPRRQLGGTFQDQKFSIVQLSANGLRIKHEETMRPGIEGRLAFSLVTPARTLAFKARVVWTSIAQRGSGPSFCISGIRLSDPNDSTLHNAVDLLLAARELEPERPRTSTSAPAAITGLSDDEVASVIRAVRLLTSDPVEASRWYTRARFALADEAVRAAAPTRARDREEALAVWEYLRRSIDLKAVASVLAWIRQTRSASAAV